MNLINIMVTIAVAGVVLWLINTYLPMDDKFKRLLNIVAIIAIVLWLLSAFGALGNLGNVRVGG